MEEFTFMNVLEITILRPLLWKRAFALETSFDICDVEARNKEEERSLEHLAWLSFVLGLMGSILIACEYLDKLRAYALPTCALCSHLR